MHSGENECGCENCTAHREIDRHVAEVIKAIESVDSSNEGEEFDSYCAMLRASVILFRSFSKRTIVATAEFNGAIKTLSVIGRAHEEMMASGIKESGGGISDLFSQMLGRSVGRKGGVVVGPISMGNISDIFGGDDDDDEGNLPH